jgi:monoamine oxidase
MKDIRNVCLHAGLKNDLETEVAIVGGGISGLYAAYRLVTDPDISGCKQPAEQVQLFEMNDRIGGRLESVTLPGMDVTGELGGMRYMESQRMVATLIESVFQDRMTNIDFPMGDDAHLFAYLRGQRLEADAWALAQARGEKLVTRYFLDERDIGFSANQLFNRIVYDVLMADPWFAESPYSQKVKQRDEYTFEFQLTNEDWDQIKPALTYCFKGPYFGRKVNDLGFWNLIKDQVSEEGYNFLADAGGYYSNTINWNAAEAFLNMVGDFSNAGTEYKTIQGGYDGIAYALASAYMEQPGARIWTENQLLRFHTSTKAGFRYELTFLHLPSKMEWKVYANKLILAMPRRSLELLDQFNFFFDPESQTDLQYNIASVIAEPSFKILMGFEKPWWSAFGAKSGHSITDLPMRQCYYFGVDPRTSHSLLLGSYNDMGTVTFWKALSDDSRKFDAKATERISLETARSLASVQASQLMVNEVIDELRELHGPDVTVPEPYVTWFKDWSEDPFGGGYHAWKAGFPVKDVMQFMRKPNSAEQIYICGEAYSGQQGWVEGALCVTEKMLQEHFAMEWPAWLEKDYYLGW